jgi:putative DNA primase/helicase
MTDDGLQVEVETGRGENKTTERKWIAAPFEILGACRDPNGHGWGKWIRWKDADGRPHTQHVADAALQRDPAPLCAMLADNGLTINRSQQRDFVTYLSAANVHGRVTIVKRTGWHEIAGQPVFVLPDAVIGPLGAERILLDAVAASPYESRGSLDDWQDGIGWLASGHSLPVLAVSAALAGPMLYLAGQDGGGLNFYGPSSIGKTTLLSAAASVWGRGSTPGYIRTWRATANGLEGAAASATDTALVLDELGQVDPREAGAALYSLSNGAGKARASRDGALEEMFLALT